MGNGVTECEWRHAPEIRGGFGVILKKSVSRVEGSCQKGCVKGSGGPDPSYPSLLRPICCDRRVSNNQLPQIPRHHREEGRRRNFSNCNDHSWIKTTAIFFPLPSSLSISFSADFFLFSTKRWSYGIIPYIPDSTTIVSYRTSLASHRW